MKLKEEKSEKLFPGYWGRKFPRCLRFQPLLAEPMYLKGYIECLGTGTADIIRRVWRFTCLVLLGERSFQTNRFLKETGFNRISG